jgi:hypothetical protein
MRKQLLLVGLIVCASISFGQFSPKEQVVFNRFTAPEWQQIIKESRGNTQQFDRQMLEYAKNNTPLIKLPNNGGSKKDSVEYFQTSQLWVAYNPYLPPFVAYSHKTKCENPEEDLTLYLTGLNLWKEYYKEKWSEINQAINAETNSDYPKLKITDNKQQSYKQYEEQLMQWQKQNPWYAKVLMKAHLEQIKSQLGL